MRTIYDIIVRPIITEASMDRTADKKYTFEVAKNATKPQIAEAVEKMFKVKVASVNVISVKKKPKRLGVHEGYTSEWKKAIVQLTEDSATIEFFDGMR
jgi:large subunit ribosomal protein L23